MKKALFLAVFLLPTLVFASFDTSLKYGMSGNNVSALQDVLVSEGCFSVSPTGYFGLLTLEGVKCFQTKHDIQPISGYFGELSRAKANAIVSVATGGYDEAELQETGSISLSDCATGDLFSQTTGKPCTKQEESVSEVEKTVKEIKETVEKQQRDIEEVKNNIIKSTSTSTTTITVNDPNALATVEIGGSLNSTVNIGTGSFTLKMNVRAKDNNVYIGKDDIETSLIDSNRHILDASDNFDIVTSFNCQNTPSDIGGCTIKDGQRVTVNYNLEINPKRSSNENIISYPSGFYGLQIKKVSYHSKDKNGDSINIPLNKVCGDGCENFINIQPVNIEN